MRTRRVEVALPARKNAGRARGRKCSKDCFARGGRSQKPRRAAAVLLTHSRTPCIVAAPARNTKPESSLHARHLSAHNNAAPAPPAYKPIPLCQFEDNGVFNISVCYWRAPVASCQASRFDALGAQHRRASSGVERATRAQRRATLDTQIAHQALSWLWQPLACRA